MPRRKDTETEVETVRPSETLALIGASTLKALLKQDDRYKSDIDGLVGELREAIGNAKDKKHLDPKAYALLKRFHRMDSDEKLANLWHTLLAYMDMAGVMKRIDSVQSLPLEDDNDGEHAADGDSGGRVARPKFGEPRTTAS